MVKAFQKRMLSLKCLLNLTLLLHSQHTSTKIVNFAARNHLMHTDIEDKFVHFINTAPRKISSYTISPLTTTSKILTIGDYDEELQFEIEI